MIEIYDIQDLKDFVTDKKYTDSEVREVVEHSLVIWFLDAKYTRSQLLKIIDHSYSYPISERPLFA